MHDGRKRSPYKSADEVSTAAYGRIYIPADRAADVLPWAMQHQAAAVSGYALDLHLVPLAGAPAHDYQEGALRGNSFWAIKQGALEDALVSGGALLV